MVRIDLISRARDALTDFINPLSPAPVVSGPGGQELPGHKQANPTPSFFLRDENGVKWKLTVGIDGLVRTEVVA